MNNLAPTLFVDFDGTLHVGNTYIGEDDEVTLDTGRLLLEFVPLLAELLTTYPDMEIVLTTSCEPIARRVHHQLSAAQIVSAYSRPDPQHQTVAQLCARRN
ncbi:hypothetical protein [Burkholderia pseudomallei]|nr:hypothetical protein [Burkholderia pseudomallei]RIV38819.1 hypothetical protein D2W70_36260 [Burkholderia pseudomallei]RIV54967.1 hypothetical protein D2W49_30630 [Burkholderia pseudomallei]